MISSEWFVCVFPFLINVLCVAFILEVATKKNVTVRKVTRGSPDSDDSFCDESPDGYLGRRDDQFLVSDRNENKFYGNDFDERTEHCLKICIYFCR